MTEMMLPWNSGANVSWSIATFASAALAAERESGFTTASMVEYQTRMTGATKTKPIPENLFKKRFLIRESNRQF